MHPEDNVSFEPVVGRAPLILGGHDFHSITEAVAAPVESARRASAGGSPLPAPPRMLGLLVLGIAWLFWEGIGIWGLNVPVGWAFDITNFVFWIGIGHAGTLISAILFLFRQKWRTSINRVGRGDDDLRRHVRAALPGHPRRPALGRLLDGAGAEPDEHSGRASAARSLWDFFAVSTYGTVSLIFWYVGLIPDLATHARPRPRPGSASIVYGVFALGWRGSQRHWRHYEMAYLILAGLATPLVLSVHSIVSMDFAVAQLPGWHTTIFPPYFVAGAIFSGFAMVVTLMVITRKGFGLENIVTLLHFDHMAKIMLRDRHRSSATPTRWSSSSPGGARTPTSSSRSSTAPSAPTGGPTGRW